MSNRTKVILAVLAVTLLGAVIAVAASEAGFTSSEPKAFKRAATATDTPKVAVDDLQKDARRIAVKGAHSVYLGKSGMVGKLIKEEMTCISLQEGPLGRGGGGCNPARDPFGGSSVMWSTVSYNESPQKFVLYGVAAESVAALGLEIGGALLPLALSEDSGFIYVVEKSKIAQADLPQAIVTLDAAGAVLERVDVNVSFGP